MKSAGPMNATRKAHIVLQSERAQDEIAILDI